MEDPVQAERASAAPSAIAAPGAPSSIAAPAAPPPIAAPGDPPASDAAHWPEGTQVLRAENLEGLLLVDGRLRGGGRDTAGILVFDTGAGHLALDHGLAVALGIADSATVTDAVGLAPRALARLELGGLQIDQVSPVLTIDATIVRRVTDRAVLGLVGQAPLAAYIVVIDHARGEIALVPGGAPGARAHDIDASRRTLPALSPRAVPVPFRLAGDGKMLVRARVADARGRRRGAPLTLVFDTGATKTVLFEPALSERVPDSRRWPLLRGLSAPTLFGASAAAVVRVPVLEVEGARAAVREAGHDATLIHSDLADILSRAVGEPVHGLLGYSFLRRHRIAIDYPRRIVWLERRDVADDERRFEYSHPGLQVERVEGAMRVVAVVEDSPAARAGIRPGDDVIALDDEPVRDMELTAFLRRLEGPPGTRLSLTVSRAGVERTVRLVRRRLL